MIGAKVDLAGCTVLLAAAPGSATRAARYLQAQCVDTLLQASTPLGALALLGQSDVLALCTGQSLKFSALRRQALAQGTPVIELDPGTAEGRITLVGGGPGALELLTLRAAAVLASADVVFCDRLGPGEFLDQLAPQARIIDVGKQPGHHKVTQERIEELMLREASRGNHVVRLKGGDPYVFGRGFEEVESATAAGIPVSVVPGLSSCITVPAAAGIPVTARGVTRAFTVISGHDPLEEQQLAQLALLGGTIVVLMGMGTLEHTAAGLRRRGLPADTPCAVVESGTTGTQRTTHATLSTLAAAARAAGCANPAVIVIGQVAALPLGLDAAQQMSLEATA
ncbi:uroporphyrinogen-III C-methyltransferase [Glutamicibacter protophormiae]|uniref:uroporphyrinogen-III C-methyltransferase n=1 Tax=Glutamicibacter protophormiae TaxID=37930 RepID=UPI002A83A185|nr:uroporphyrinogen-III C-methyltransferase [Glutamicibacter protophormiae]WPR64206.1 uroporphyrinogen-III C-methyltransferase [Glutamicibacter protophormiae]WPR67700.1 uroporphyrinogen-III C-methyltransferase [Glutamicibacter protophormiae]